MSRSGMLCRWFSPAHWLGYKVRNDHRAPLSVSMRGGTYNDAYLNPISVPMASVALVRSPSPQLYVRPFLPESLARLVSLIDAMNVEVFF